HDARAERAGILVRGLHELTARSGDRARHVAGVVFARIAHVEEIKAARIVGAPALDRGEIDARDAEAARHAIGGGFGPGKSVARDITGAAGLAAVAVKAGEGPAHGAVA